MTTKQERAAKAVQVLENRLTRLDKKLAEAKQQMADLEAEVQLVKARLDYAKQSPDLPSGDEQPTLDDAAADVEQPSESEQAEAF